MAIFDPLQNRHPSTDHQTICHRSLRRRPLRLCQIRCISVHGGFWAHGWKVKYNQNYFYLCLFWELTYRSDPSMDFHAWWLKRRGLAQGCALWGFFFTLVPIYSGSKTQKPQFWAWIGVFNFKPNSRNRKTCILSKLLHRFQPNFAQW